MKWPWGFLFGLFAPKWLSRYIVKREVWEMWFRPRRRRHESYDERRGY